MILDVAESSRIAEVRRSAVAMARAEGFDDEDAARVALLATELSTNICKHAGSGQVVIGHFDDCDGRGVELLAIDRGKGIADVGKSLVDGYSTAGGMGSGLGTLQRMADVFALFSRPGLGTAVLVRIRPRGTKASTPMFQVGAVSGIYPGETMCGDGWSIRQSAHRARLMIIDGSGHGPAAAAAARAGMDAFQASSELTLERTAEALHRALMPTRGGVLAIADCDLAAGFVSYVGIGNISGAIVENAVAHRMISQNGTAGRSAPRIRSFTYPFTHPPTLILHSDGLTAKWDIASYPGLSEAHPSLIAAVFYRDFQRGRDDATVVVMRPGQPS